MEKIMILIQLILFCGIFTLLVRISAIGGAINALYFYPIAYQEVAYKRGIANKDETKAKRKRFMIPFVITIFVCILLIVGLRNKAADFKTAYAESLLLLEVMNWYDGIVIDRLWVGHSRFWIIPGMEDVPYVQSWKEVLSKRGKLTLVWFVIALIPAAIISLLS